jgi:manganese/zinc/iron transport system permease protein
MDTWLLIFTACLVAIPAAILGVLLMMKQMIMVGDAISHAVLPGIVLAYLITDSRDDVPMLFGAAAMGMLTTFIISFLKNQWQIQNDAAIGTSFTFLFAIGVLMIAFFAGKNTDLDQDCVLYGDLETSILDQSIYKDFLIGTKVIWRLIPFSLLVCTIVILGFKSFKIWTFNSDFGKIRGLKTTGIQLLVLSLVSIYAVLCFESVGVIMVIGLLVLPAATVVPHSRSLKRLLFYSACIGILSCILGVLLGVGLNVSVAPSIVVVNAAFFLFSLLFLQLKNRIIHRVSS